jgi:hypothetical protein
MASEFVNVESIHSFVQTQRQAIGQRPVAQFPKSRNNILEAQNKENLRRLRYGR